MATVMRQCFLGGAGFVAALSLIASFKTTVALPSGGSAMWTIIRAQQAYRLENSVFAPKIKLLDARLDYTNYSYAILQADTKYFVGKAIPRLANLRSYAGGGLQKGDQFSAIVCESNELGRHILLPYIRKGSWFCGSDSHPLSSSTVFNRENIQ